MSSKDENPVDLENSKSIKSKPKRFLSWSVLNQDLAQLEFFRRVLEEATDKSTPLLERLKFLSVFSSNLDEFFMVRVSGIKEMLDIEDIRPMPGELTPREQLAAIRKRVLPLIEEHSTCLREEVIPQLQSRGVVIAPYKWLS
ncbi:MAG: RNA degradosome polyphosphate kinase, partial [Acidobacteria bacterium]